jgi:hypothetical protein
MQLNNPLNDISKKDNIINIKEVVRSTPLNLGSLLANVPNTKEKESESDENVAVCGLCCICYLLCLPLFSSCQ